MFVCIVLCIWELNIKVCQDKQGERRELTDSRFVVWSSGHDAMTSDDI